MTVLVHRVFDIPVKRKESGLAPRQAGCHGDFLVAHGEVNQAALELEQRFSRIPIHSILFLGVRHYLTGQAVLEVPSSPAADR